MRKLLYLGIVFFGLFLITLTSCKKEEIDIRNEYVGTWNYTSNGSLTLYFQGDAIATEPVNESGIMEVEKSGDNHLIIGGVRFRVDGDYLTADPTPINQGENGVIVNGTQTNSGRLSSSIITIHSKITGTWRNSYNDAGNLTGNRTFTLTR